MKLYFDTCCWNRPSDELTVSKNRKQAAAILRIIKQARRQGFTILGSDALEEEIGRITDTIRHARVSGLYRRSITEMAEFVESAFNYVEPLAQTAGMEGLDIHHLAFAVGAGTDYLITTDEDFIKAASSMNVSVRVVNPLNFNIGGTT